MKNHEFMPDILVSPIFSQLSKREEKKIIQRCSNLVIQQMQVLFLFSSQKFMHCQIIKELIPFLSKSFMNPNSWKHITSKDPEIYTREGQRDNLFAISGGGGVQGLFSVNSERIIQTPTPYRSTHVWYSLD